jgi:hypothetical protein
MRIASVFKVCELNDRDLALLLLFFMCYRIRVTDIRHSLEIDHWADRPDIGFRNTVLLCAYPQIMHQTMRQGPGSEGGDTRVIED